MSVNRFLCLVLFAAIPILNGCGKTESGGNSPKSVDDKTGKSTVEKQAENKPKLVVNQKDMDAAQKMISLTCSQIGFMQDDASFERSRTGVDNALGIIDVSAVRKAIDLIATLPDNKENEFIKPLSELVPKVREMMDLYEKAATSGKPFSDGSNTGKRIVELANEFGLSFSVAYTESMKLVETK